MTKKMLIDAAHPEEVRVAVLSHNKIEDFDFESINRKPLRGNIFLARVTRVEPSLQAAFVDYGGNRHGFLAFSEIHPDYYQIPVSDRKILQEAEKEVAELAAQLELVQRGDEIDEDDDGADDALRDAAGDDDTASENDDDDAQASGEEEEDRPPKRKRRSRRKKAKTRTEASDDQGADNADQNDNDQNDSDRGDSDQGNSGSDKKERDEEEEEEDEDEVASDGNDDDDDGDDEGDEGLDSASRMDANDEEISDEDEEQDEGDDDADEDDDDDEDEDDADEHDGVDEGPKVNRQALLEQYKDAKRKRANLLRNYKIQEVIKRRQILLIQVVKEERGNKGAALTTYLSLAGRYCVLMPNTARGGGISRKIANGSDRRRLRRAVDSLDVPQGMGLIIRTAGAKRTKTEIKRDYDYLLRLWENIRSLTLKSIAPCLIYEEASLIKRAIRDLYDKDISKVLVEGEAGYREAKDFMKMLMPSHAKNVQPHKDRTPLFLKHGVETQLDGMYQPSVRLKSGGYIVINQTEALVAIDVNSGRATRERNIEQTALKTNMEAAEEAARQFRLRDLAGLVVIDFIDMEESRNNRKVEKALKDAMKADRARVQVGRISSFGLLELSRQRRRSGIVDGTTQACPTCAGAGAIRSHEMAALRILRAIEGEAISGKTGLLRVRTSTDVALHILNHNRDWITRIETNNGVSIEITADPDKTGDDFDLEKSGVPREVTAAEQNVIRADQGEALPDEPQEDGQAALADSAPVEVADQDEADDKPKKRRRRRRSRKDSDSPEQGASDSQDGDASGDEESDGDDARSADASDDGKEGDAKEGDEGRPKKRRRRGRRGGKRNRRDGDQSEADVSSDVSSGDGDTTSDKAAEKSSSNEPDESQPEASQPPHSVKPDTDASHQDGHAPEPQAPAEASNENGGEKDAPKSEPESAPESEPEQPASEAAPPEPKDPEEIASDAPKKPARKGWWQRSASS